MSFFKDFCMLIAKVPLGKNYALICTALVALLLCLLTAICIILKTKKRMLKLVALSVSACTFSLLLFKITCDFLFGVSINVYSTSFSIVILPVIIAECIVIFNLKENKSLLSNSEKQLIDRLLSQNEVEESLLNEIGFSRNPFRRAEYLETEKGFNPPGFYDFNLNPACVKGYVDSLLTKELSNEDRQEVTEIENALEKYKLKKLSDFERDDFSTKLQRLLKLTAKYDRANFDVF